MKSLFLIHYGEIGLKGGNRKAFEDLLIQNIRRRVVGLARVERRYGRIAVFLDEEHRAKVLEALVKTFGIENVSFGWSVGLDLEEVKRAACALALGHGTAQTFKVSARRSNKTFPHPSSELNREVGACVLGGDKKLRVQMVDPDLVIHIEVGDKEVYVTGNKTPGPGGLPVGVAGKALCLLSGGIDSPVAAWYMMKRGCQVDFVHFHSMPYTDRASVQKVEELAAILSPWQGPSTLYEIPLLPIQQEIMRETDQKYRVLLYRRFMIRLAEHLAVVTGAKALVTGESLSQVASQTVENIASVEAVATLPIFRPLIGFDKQEIMDKARAVGTYETSIIPHGDCCSLFTPRHPATKSKPRDLEAQETRLATERLLEEAYKNQRAVEVPATRA